MTSQARPLRRPKSLTALAVDEIRRRIVSGELALGAPLSENALAAELGVSKTPVREALLQLKIEGLVSTQPQRGSFVFEMSAQEVRELSELRETLEVAVLERSLLRDPTGLATALRTVADGMQQALDTDELERYRDLDAEFHRALVGSSGNRYLVDSYDGIGFRIQALRARLYRDSELNSVTMDDHAKLCGMIDLRDLPAARQLLINHINRSATAYIARLDAPPP